LKNLQKNKYLKSIKRLFVLIFICLLFLTSIPDKEKVDYSKTAKKSIKVTLLYSNSLNNYLEDCHCPSNPFGGLVRRATLIKKIRKSNPNVLLFDTGDLFSVDEEKMKSSYTIKSYEYLKYDAICIGDQDLVNGVEFFRKEFLAKLPVVTANFSICKKKVCHLVGAPFKIIKLDDINVGVIGVISKNAFKYYPKKVQDDIKIDYPVQTIKHYMNLLKKKCDIIVLLSHSGLDMDKQMAKNVRGIDVIIGGHSQSLIKKRLVVNNTWIVQAGKNGEHLGEMNIFYNKKEKKIKSINNTLHILDDKVQDDPYIRKLITEYKSEVYTSQAWRNYNKKIYITYFYSEGCKSCEQVKRTIMPALEKKYKFNFLIEPYNVKESNNFEKMVEYSKELKSRSKKVPVIIINSSFLSGIDQIRTDLEKEVKEVLKK